MNTRKKILTASLVLLSLAALVISASCTPIKKGEYAKGTEYVGCDDGFRKIMEEEIDVFEYQYPEAFILPSYMSENACIDSLKAGKCQLIIITRELTKPEVENIKKDLKRVVRQKCIAVDAVALIVNKDNPVGLLTMNEIRDILMGKITSWQQLAVPDTSKIKIVFDNEGSSTVNYMREKFLPKGMTLSQNPNTFAQKNNQQVFEAVQKDPNVLGIISVSWLGENLKATQMPMEKRLEDLKNPNDTIDVRFSEAIKVLKVRGSNEDPVGYQPYQAYINSGEYPLYRKVFAVSTASNSTLAHSFYAFLTGFVGQKIISQTGIMPYNVQPRVVQVN